ncbi:hypothetical protein LY78DRAFT_750187 [Colletotrichum sublineola]|nr:hypothetical protein LY78DRAFT_750187 [Colletotrichum sublineola]
MTEPLLTLLLLFGVLGNALSLADSETDLDRLHHAPRVANGTADGLISSTSAVANGTASLTDDKSLSPGTLPLVNIQTSSGTLTSGSTATTSSTTTGSGTLTDEPHSTVTILPSGVSFQTLDRVTYTSPTYITTTSPGSNHPTVVPIIIPFVGPPMICFNCFVTFPPNIKIDVPQFCIQLFGLKIGNCPPKKDDKKGGDEEEDEGGGEKEDDDEKKDDDEKPTKSEKQSTTTSTSSSSCTVTVTATHRSVFCSVTRVCSGKTEARPTAPAAKGRLKRGNPDLGQWPDPADYPDHQGFIADQIDGIARNTLGRPRYSPKLVQHFSGYPLSAAWVPFKSDVEALALQGLYGCTSIILVSRRGAWVSHIWETVIKNKDRLSSFSSMVESYLPRGMTPSDPHHKYYEYGMAEMKDRPELGEVGVMFGDDHQDADTPSSLNMRAFIVTPRAYMSPWIYMEPDGRALPHEVINDIHQQRGTVRTPTQIERLKQEIADIYGDIPLEVLDYNAYIPKLEHTKNWDSKKVMTDDDGTEYILRDYMAVKLRTTVRGKFLLQYQPARACDQTAEWRLWFEGQPVGDRADAWLPLPNQLFAPGGVGVQPGRRQENVCPVQSAPPVPSSPTSAGGSASSVISQPASGVSSTQASWKPPLSGNRTLSSPPNVPTKSASGVGHPPGSNPVLPTTRINTTTPWVYVSTTMSRPGLPTTLLNTTTLRVPGNTTNLSMPATISIPVPSTIHVSTTSPRASITVPSPWIPTTVNNPSDTILTTVKVTNKPPTTQSPGLTVIPITPATTFTAKAPSISEEVAKTTTASSMPPPMTTTPSAGKPLSTSKEAAKTTSSPPSKPPGPAPSEAVAIYYVDTLMVNYNRMIEVEGAWWMFPVGVKGDQVDHDPCGKEPQGWMFLETPLSLQNVPWPPSLDAEKFFFDHRYCKYKAPTSEGDGYGTLACEKVAEFACERDPRATMKLACESDPVAERMFVPRVLCRFPTTDHRPEVDEGKGASVGWVKTKVPLLGPP